MARLDATRPPRSGFPRRARGSLQASANDCRQRDGIVVQLITRAVHQGDPASRCPPGDIAREVISPSQLLTVAALELGPLLWIVPEPLSQFLRWRDLLHPFVH